MPFKSFVSWLSFSVIAFSLVSCTPPDKAYETVHSRRRVVTPLSVPNNPGIGYSYYLTGRLLQAKYLLETAWQKGQPLSAVAEENKKCRRHRLMDSTTNGREVFYFQYRNCQTNDDRVEIRIFGEERFEVLRTPRAGDSSQQVLEHLDYKTQEMTVDLKPLKGLNLALKKKAEIDEDLDMVADLVSSSSYTDEQGVNHWEDKYSFYFRTAPGNDVFQDLVLGDMTAKENMTENFQIFGFFKVRDGQVVEFEDGEMRLNTAGSRSVRSKDRSTDFSKYNTTKIVLTTYKGKPLHMDGVCSSPVGLLRRVAFNIPKIASPPEEDKKASRAYELNADGFVELRTGQSLGWSSCLAETWGRALPYGQMFLR